MNEKEYGIGEFLHLVATKTAVNLSQQGQDVNAIQAKGYVKVGHNWHITAS
jgi:hypothetical protein